MEYAQFKVAVIASDGARIGTISRVDGLFMRITRGWLRRGLWVPTEYIAEATPREVVLSVPSTGLSRFVDVHPIPAPQPIETMLDAA